MADRIVHDLKYALRQIRRYPGFAAAAIVSLSLGIGANTAMFSVLNAVLLRPLPVPHPSELFKLKRESRVPVAQRFSYRAFDDLRAAATPGSVASASQTLRANITFGAATHAERANVQLVSGDFFQLLSVGQARGRLIQPADDRLPGAHPIAVISHAYWLARFALAPDVLGTRLSVNGAPFTIVGVAARGFNGVFLEAPTDIWIPTMMQATVGYYQNFSANTADAAKPWVPQDGIIWLDIFVRASADAKDRVAGALNAAYHKRLLIQADAIGDPEQRHTLLDSRIVLDSFALGGSRLRERFTPLLYALMGMVALVLVIACANTANLLLARSAARQREIAIRLSIGAGRGRLIQQLLTESLVLAGIAAAAGVILAQWSADALVGMVVRSVAGVSASIVQLDARVLAFTAVAALVTGLAFGLAPAIRAAGIDPGAALKLGGKGVQGAARRNPARLLVGAQVALSLLLVTGAGLFMRSVYNLAHVELGFDRDRVLSVAIDPRHSGIAPAALPAVYARMIERLQAVPGVASAAVAECGLAAGCRSASDGIAISGYTAAPLEQVLFQENRVSAAYLPTVGIAQLRGRNFDARDRTGAPKVAIVNQALVQRYFAGRDPIGQRFGYEKPDTEIVGVIADARVYSSREPAVPMAYYPIDQAMLYATNLVVRASGDPPQLTNAVREALREAAPTLVVDRMTTLAQQVDDGLRTDRLVALLATGFGALAVVLACVGLYGVMSYAVARRTADIGVRMALGARPEAVLREILLESSAMIAMGLAVGVPLAAAGGRAVASLLFGVGPWDISTLAAAAVTLAVLGLSAAFVPARRASRVDPLIALRHE